MKRIDGVRYFTKNEVAEEVGRNHQTIHLWHKASEELEAQGKERLIPAPLRLDNGYRMWSESDLQKIKEFADTVGYGTISKSVRKVEEEE